MSTLTSMRKLYNERVTLQATTQARVVIKGSAVRLTYDACLSVSTSGHIIDQNMLHTLLDVRGVVTEVSATGERVLLARVDDLSDLGRVGITPIHALELDIGEPRCSPVVIDLCALEREVSSTPSLFHSGL